MEEGIGIPLEGVEQISQFAIPLAAVIETIPPIERLKLASAWTWDIGDGASLTGEQKLALGAKMDPVVKALVKAQPSIAEELTFLSFRLHRIAEYLIAHNQGGGDGVSVDGGNNDAGLDSTMVEEKHE